MARGSEGPLDTGVSNNFPDHPLFRELKWFRGTPDPREVVLKYIDQTVEKTEAEMRSKNAMTSWRSNAKAKVDVIRAVRDYVSLIKRVSEQTCEKTEERFAEEEVRIIQARTVFDFETWLARVMFVIDAAPEKILEFSELLNQIETTLLMGEGFVVELNYVNKRGSRLDSTTIRQDFPFVGKVATRPKCAQNCESCALA